MRDEIVHYVAVAAVIVLLLLTAAQIAPNLATKLEATLSAASRAEAK